MNEQQATEIGRRIINTMRPTPPLAEWLEVLTPLDFDQALITFRELRDRTDEGLRIATYRAAYSRAGTPRSSTSTSTHEASENCPHCRGSGWADGPPIPYTANGQPHAYTTVIPCQCAHQEFR